jgi:hypothetical protein
MFPSGSTAWKWWLSIIRGAGDWAVIPTPVYKNSGIVIYCKFWAIIDDSIVSSNQTIAIDILLNWLIIHY